MHNTTTSSKGVEWGGRSAKGVEWGGKRRRLAAAVVAAVAMASLGAASMAPKQDSVTWGKRSDSVTWGAPKVTTTGRSVTWG